MSCCPRRRAVGHTPRLACVCTLPCLDLARRGLRLAPQSTSTLPLVGGAPGTCLGIGEGGEGVLVVTPWLKGEGKPCMGPQPGQPTQRADPPPGARSARQWVLPRYLPLLEPLGDLRHPTLRILPPVAAPHPQQGSGGGVRYTGGAWAWKPRPGKPLSRSPEPIGAGDLTQSKVFFGAAGGLEAGSLWEPLFLRCEERGWVKLQRSGGKLQCIPQWEFI